jgi:FtsP/CotA-like multicopper oxidase with cupredoxin domain
MSMILIALQVYPNLGKTKLVGYDGMAPGPTFMMRKGTEAVVRFINHADRANSVHLHGSYCKYNVQVRWHYLNG